MGRNELKTAERGAFGSARARPAQVDRCKAASKCPYCGARNGPVRKVAGAGALKLSHEKSVSYTHLTLPTKRIV